MCENSQNASTILIPLFFLFQEHQSLLGLTERETRYSPLIKHNATFVIIVEVYFYENRSCRISSSIDLCAMFLPKDTNIVREGVAQSIPTWFASLRTAKNFENESGRNREGVEMWQMNPFLHCLGGKC